MAGAVAPPTSAERMGGAADRIGGAARRGVTPDSRVRSSRDAVGLVRTTPARNRGRDAAAVGRTEEHPPEREETENPRRIDLTGPRLHSRPRSAARPGSAGRVSCSGWFGLKLFGAGCA